MQTHVSALTPNVLMPAPAPVGPDDVRRSFTVGVPRTLEFTDSIGGTTVEGELQVGDDHRYELVRLQLRADSIGPEELRSVPVRQLIVQAARRHAEGVVMVDNRMTTKAFNRQELSQDEYVAALWWLARVCRDNPNKLIAGELGITVAAAAQRVAGFRRAGVIPPADKRGGRY